MHALVWQLKITLESTEAIMISTNAGTLGIESVDSISRGGRDMLHIYNTF